MLMSVTPPTDTAYRKLVSARRVYTTGQILVFSLALGGLLLLFDKAILLSLHYLANLATFWVFLIIGISYLRSSRGIWSAASLYLSVFSVFHFGLTFAYGLNLPISPDLQGTIHWLFISYAREAIVLSLIGLLACALGVSLTFLREPSFEPIGAFDEVFDRVCCCAGMAITVAAVMAWFGSVISVGGTDLLVASYAAYLYATADLSLSYIYFAIGIGLILLAASKPTLLHVVGLAAFGGWVAVALPLGLRGEILFPTVAGLAVLARRSIPLSTAKTLGLSLLLLVVIALVRDLRQVGLQGYALSDIRIRPLDALVELGSSLRPVAEVAFWHREGEEYIYGASYWAPFERALFRLIPDLASQRLDAESDDRLMNVLIIRRVGPIGFSPIAEAHRNFGQLGVALVMLITGWLLGRIDQWPNTQIRQVALGIILLPLLIQIRNSFVHVPFQIIGSLLLLYVLVLLARFTRRMALYASDYRSRTSF